MIDPERPIAITMGDPSGIGPEIVAKAMLDRQIRRRCVVIGDPVVVQHAFSQIDAAVRVNTIRDIKASRLAGGSVNLIASSSLDVLPPVGVVDPASGKAGFDAITTAIDLALVGAVAGIVTAPIHKEALAAAGACHPGHTEILAERTGASRVAMMLANEDIRTVLVTIHCSLLEAIRRVDFDAELSAIRLAHAGGRALGIEAPRIAVAGLNPHAGEGGLFGVEEITVIAPAIEAARQEGIDASGPWPGDTVFMQARHGRFDVVVAQYHDQGLIPVKYLGLEKGVNITLGLPFVRTSPDHGTAFDIAGRGIADPASLETAIDYALRLADAASEQER
jgi:4-hydroxythreonine-4-phosphate dehydrogenase